MEQGLIKLDAAEFEQLANQGAHAELAVAQDEKAETEALDYYSRALELYKGDFLPGCLYEDWAAPERERLLTLFLSTAERYSRLLAARAEWERCLAVCRLILARDNCWEEAYRLMMLALWKQGHRAAALRTYEKCVATLSEELGVEPVPQTAKLYHEILLD
jgi:DNA-binding SARP family transcriptional activator